jgi:hypothetical protein
MDVYHTTNDAAARAIVHAGFRDHTALYMTTQPFTGVWVADRPLDYNEGCKGDILLGITIPTTLFVEYEWVEEGKPYRESLIPAALLNAHGPARYISDEEADSIPDDRWTYAPPTEESPDAP